MSGRCENAVLATVQLLGRFLYRLMLAVVIVWLIGLLVQLLLGQPPDGSGVVSVSRD